MVQKDQKLKISRRIENEKKKAPVREIMADPIYNSKVITKFVNAIMLDGKNQLQKNPLWYN